MSVRGKTRHVVEEGRGRDIEGSKGSGSGVVAASWRRRRRDEARARYDDDGGDDGRVLVACRRRSQGSTAPRATPNPATCGSSPSRHCTLRALPRRLLIPPGSYPHGVLKWDEWDAVGRDEVARSGQGTGKQRDVLKLQQPVVVITFLSTCSLSLFFSVKRCLVLFFMKEQTFRVR